MRMDGLEEGFNDNARDRAIVMHPAKYADVNEGERMGRLGGVHLWIQTSVKH